MVAVQAREARAHCGGQRCRSAGSPEPLERASQDP